MEGAPRNLPRTLHLTREFTPAREGPALSPKSGYFNGIYLKKLNLVHFGENAKFHQNGCFLVKWVLLTPQTRPWGAEWPGPRGSRARAWEIHARAWTDHARAGNVHARGRISHARARVSHARAWTSHARAWTSRARAWWCPAKGIVPRGHCQGYCAKGILPRGSCPGYPAKGILPSGWVVWACWCGL